MGFREGSGADVSRAEDELHAKTQSHRCLGYSLEQEGGGKENRNNIKLEAILTSTCQQDTKLLTGLKIANNKHYESKPKLFPRCFGYKFRSQRTTVINKGK